MTDSRPRLGAGAWGPRGGPTLSRAVRILASGGPRAAVRSVGREGERDLPPGEQTQPGSRRLRQERGEQRAVFFPRSLFHVLCKWLCPLLWSAQGTCLQMCARVHLYVCAGVCTHTGTPRRHWGSVQASAVKQVTGILVCRETKPSLHPRLTGSAYLQLQSK